MKIHNTFLKMQLVCTMGNVIFFVICTREIWLYYWENRSSRFVNRLYYGENVKTRVFLYLFWRPKKKQKMRPLYIMVHELIEDPLDADLS